jgi:hypothetical protein
MISREKETNMCADCKSDACIIDVRGGSNRTEEEEKRRKKAAASTLLRDAKLGKCFLCPIFQLCCNGGFAGFGVEVDSRRNDLNFEALLEGDKFDEVASFEGAVNNIVDGRRFQPGKMI